MVKLSANKQPQATGTVTRTEDAEAADAAVNDPNAVTAANDDDDSASQETFDQAAFLENRGYIVGGKYVEGVPEKFKERAVTIDRDLPLTATIPTHHNGEDFVVITFIHGDPENPYNWSKARKTATVMMLCGMTLWIGLATTAYSSGLARMAKDLHSTVEVGQLGLFSFNFVCALSPMMLAPFCEFSGRHIVYVGGFLCFTLLFIGLSLCKTMYGMIILRAFLGLFGCVGTILVGGTMDDIFKPKDRAVPMASFAWVAILGTVAAPIYCGFIDMKIGWRWVEAIQGFANVPLLVIVIFFFKETRDEAVMAKRLKVVRKATGDEKYVTAGKLLAPDVKSLLYQSSVKAGYMLVTEGVVFFFGLWIAFSWFLTFMFLSVIPITYTEKKGWNEGVSGLPYIGLALGCSAAYGANFLQINKYNKISRETGGKAPPEARLYGVMFGAPFLPIGLFIYSFTQYAYVHWIGPIIGLFCIAFGIFFIFESCYSYIADCYGPSASSGIAGTGLMRNTLGAVAPLFSTYFFENVGSQYAGLILAIIAVILTFIPFVLFKWGPDVRRRSKQALSPEALEEEEEGGNDDALAQLQQEDEPKGREHEQNSDSSETPAPSHNDNHADPEKRPKTEEA